MAIFTNFLISLIMALWFGTLAIFAIQNVSPTALRFTFWESIQLPISLLLTFCFGVGLVLGALMPILWQRSQKRRPRFEEFDEFDFEE